MGRISNIERSLSYTTLVRQLDTGVRRAKTLKRANEALGVRIDELENGAVLRATQSRLSEREEVIKGGIDVDLTPCMLRQENIVGNCSQDPPPALNWGGRALLFRYFDGGLIVNGGQKAASFGKRSHYGKNRCKSAL